MALHPWSAREIHIHISGDDRQWCVDDGEGDPIPCGAGDAAEERARLLAEMLNLGFATQAKSGAKNPIMDAAKAIHAKCGDIQMLVKTISPPQNKAPNSDLAALLAALANLQNLSAELQKSLLGE
ncbi:MAG: hypothetical protein ABSG66_07720 [Stellaceae bacterium]|jgi:hypothetical protein